MSSTSSTSSRGSPDDVSAVDLLEEQPTSNETIRSTDLEEMNEDEMQQLKVAYRALRLKRDALVNRGGGIDTLAQVAINQRMTDLEDELGRVRATHACELAHVRAMNVTLQATVDTQAAEIAQLQTSVRELSQQVQVLMQLCAH
jgi:hypothetical protein